MEEKQSYFYILRQLKKFALNQTNLIKISDINKLKH